MKIKKLILGFLTTTMLAVNVFAHEGDDYFGHHGMMMQWHEGIWGWSLNSILMSVILILIIILIFIVIQKQLQKK